MPRTLVDELRAHRDAFGGEHSSLVFTNGRGSPVRRSSFLRSHLRPALGRAGLDSSVRTHDLRRTAITVAILEGGASPIAAKELAGHASIGVTFDVYGKLFQSTMTDLAMRLDEVWTQGASRGGSDSASANEVT